MENTRDKYKALLASLGVHLILFLIAAAVGIFSVAAMKGLDVLAVNVMKTSARGYKVYVARLSYDRRAPRRQQMQQLADSYVKELERRVRQYPLQWFNFHDFWS